MTWNTSGQQTRPGIRLHLFVLALAVLIAGGSGAVLLASYWGLYDRYGHLNAALLALVFSLAAFAVLVYVAKQIADWATKTGRV